MTAETLVAWLGGIATRDALLSAWRGCAGQPLAAYEAGVLAAAARAGRSQTPMTIAIPGGRSRLPLLAAVHAAALQLPGFPSPFSGGRAGPVALATMQFVRRAELAELDAAGVPVSPALNPARLRSDKSLATLPGGRTVLQGSEHRLLLAGPSARWVVPQTPPAVVIIDASAESQQFAAEAVAWAEACEATPIAFTDIVYGTPLENSVTYPCGWSQILAASAADDTGISRLAPVRGHAAILLAGELPGLSSSAAILAAARRLGPLPLALTEASVLWRQLDELVVPVATYDAACPRWHTPTLSERLEDLLEIRSQDFPSRWRTWAQTGWAGVKEGLAVTRDTLSNSNVKAAMLVEAADADLRAGLTVDIALPSRTARDAVIWNLAEAGVPIPADGRLIVRSLADAGAWEPPRATLLAAPPTRRLRQRVTAADVGPLSVLCYDHEIKTLRRQLYDALNEPMEVGGPYRRLLPPAYDAAPVVPAQPPAVILSVAAPADGESLRADGRLPYLADATDIAALDALREPVQETGGDLPDEQEFTLPKLTVTGPRDSHGLTVSVPLTVVSSSGGRPLIVHVPADGKAARILDGTVRKIAVRDVLPGMLLAGLDGLTPFDRLRPLLPEARGPVTRMLIAAWDQALEAALRRTGGPVALAEMLGEGGARTSSSAVAAWNDEARIGPRDATNVTRIGQFAGHPVVAGHGHAIAVTMRRLRQLHQSIGQLVASPGRFDADAAAELEQLLGPDALSVLAETVIYRVTAVGAIITVPRTTMYQPSPGPEQEADGGR